MALSRNKAEKSKPMKKKILTNVEYTQICHFINEFCGDGLPIDCELNMANRIFNDIEPLALVCILQSQLFYKARGQHWRHENRAELLLKIYDDQCHLYDDSDLLIRMACAESINPISMCRFLLQEKYYMGQRPLISQLLKHPYLINDSRLAANVQQCLYSDNQEGPITDLRRRMIGEEYELKLKQLANAAGIFFYDERDLRRMGYDKTPDIKVILPFLYKGHIVNWIESKANFGDPKSHKWNIQQQLLSYCNRFGPGIIIYWFGYHEETPLLPDNNIGITILADFPDREHLDLMLSPQL
ncbi:uncharacterized protein C15orf41 homolog [Drosophila navojoa]|nr:uncharacterized protein C15orf41 homolog [Drosophila navojoa]